MGRIAVALIVSAWVIPVSIIVNRIVPEPYMDEIFHVPQAQQYCKCNFRSWDPMITTPPGLYFISLAYVASLFPGLFLLQGASKFIHACSPAVLRSTNGVLSVICSILVYDIITHLKPSLGDRRATLCAAVLALYPLHWFFTFLYYTDVASLTSVLAMYLLSLKKKYLLSALLGALAVLVRQTNILWMLFVASAGIIEHTLACRKANNKLKDTMLESQNAIINDGRQVAAAPNLTKRRVQNHHSPPIPHLEMKTVTSAHHASGSSSSLFHDTCGLYIEIQEILYASWHCKWELLASFSPFLVILLAFVAFVRWNGSIVLGAKEAHAVSPHFAQFLYFGLVSALLMPPLPFTLKEVAVKCQMLRRNKFFVSIQLFSALVFGFMSVHFFSVAHPYLLADNRHYTFYLWRKVINSHWSAKYLMVPLYIYSWFSISSSLLTRQKKMWVVAYILCTAATLVPAPLIEFRYYTIPFFFLAIHSRVDDGRSWLLIGMLYLAVNAFTMLMFLYRPFSWSHEAGTQRFIW